MVRVFKAVSQSGRRALFLVLARLTFEQGEKKKASLWGENKHVRTDGGEGSSLLFKTSNCKYPFPTGERSQLTASSAACVVSPLTN